MNTRFIPGAFALVIGMGLMGCETTPAPKDTFEKREKLGRMHVLVAHWWQILHCVQDDRVRVRCGLVRSMAWATRRDGASTLAPAVSLGFLLYKHPCRAGSCAQNGAIQGGALGVFGAIGGALIGEQNGRGGGTR
jgi:hypothetical protein